MRLFILCLSVILAFIANGFCEENGTEWKSDKLGEWIIVPMKNAPYPHQSRENGWSNKDNSYSFYANYSDSSVGILIPPFYEQKDAVDLAIHFHGHMNNVAKQIEQFNLRHQLNDSHRNIILLLPQGPKNARDSGCGKMEDPNGLKNLIAEAVDFLFESGKIKTKQIGNVILSGHSGAYRPLAYCLDVGGMDSNISEVYLMDASYANLESYSNWAARSGGRFISIFTSHLAGENVKIMRNIQQMGVKDYPILLDEDVTTETLKKNRIIFIHTALGHNELMFETQYLSRFWETGEPDKAK